MLGLAPTAFTQLDVSQPPVDRAARAGESGFERRQRNGGHENRAPHLPFSPFDSRKKALIT
jgi:hypothetical protein